MLFNCKRSGLFIIWSQIFQIAIDLCEICREKYAHSGYKRHEALQQLMILNAIDRPWDYVVVSLYRKQKEENLMDLNKKIFEIIVTRWKFVYDWTSTNQQTFRIRTRKIILMKKINLRVSCCWLCKE